LTFGHRGLKPAEGGHTIWTKSAQLGVEFAMNFIAFQAKLMHRSAIAASALVVIPSPCNGSRASSFPQRIR